MIVDSIGKEVEAQEIPIMTQRVLLEKGLIEDCPRLYFGPRSHRFRLTQAGKDFLKDYIGNGKSD